MCVCVCVCLCVCDIGCVCWAHCPWTGLWLWLLSSFSTCICVSITLFSCFPTQGAELGYALNVCTLKVFYYDHCNFPDVVQWQKRRKLYDKTTPTMEVFREKLFIVMSPNLTEVSLIHSASVNLKRPFTYKNKTFIHWSSCNQTFIHSLIEIFSNFQEYILLC